MYLNSELVKTLRRYNKFKHEFKIEIYLYVVNDHLVRKNIARFRISTNKFNIDSGRQRWSQGVPLSEIICDIWNVIETIYT